MAELPPNFFTAPVSKSLKPGVYAVVARRPAMADPFLMATSFFCPGKDDCKWGTPYADIMNIKIAIDPDEPEDRRDISRGFVKADRSFIDDPNFVGPREVGCAPENVPLNVMHFPVRRARDDSLGGQEGATALEHALVIGPCNMREYGLALRALRLIGVNDSYVTMHFQGNDETKNERNDGKE